MFKIPLKELKEKILESNKITAKELEARIKNKINELSGLISEEGAAHIIANELNIELVSQKTEKLKVKEIYAGMRSISVVGKVVKKFPAREFKKGESTGKVCSLLIGDATGTIRVVFWNEQVELVDTLKEEDILLVKKAYVRENNGQKEIHLGQEGEIEINPEGEVVGPVRQSSAYDRKKIQELQGNEEGVEIMATIVQAFDPRFFYVCPQCSKKVQENEQGFHCEVHGPVSAILSYVLNLVLDDGSGTIRSVFWKNQTNNLLGKSDTEVAGYKEDLSTFEEVKTDLLGEQFRLLGKVRRNEMFDRLEFNVQMVEKAKPEDELARLQK